MKLFCLLAVFLALALNQVKGQDDAAPADAGADDAAAADAGVDDAGGDGEKEECEESWEYIEFLREVSDKSEGILESIRDQKSQVGNEIILQNVIRDTMTEVLIIRSDINDRIFKIRKEEIATCPDQNIQQEKKLDNLRMEIMSILLSLVDDEKNANPEGLKEIGTDLLKFRGLVNNEIMIVLMTPQGQAPIQTNLGDCGECDILQQIRDKINGVVDCANSDDDTADDADAGDADAAADTDADGAEAGGAGECMPPPMYFMDIMEANRMIDTYTEQQFNKLFQSMDDSERTNLEASLTQMKEVREMLEQTIQKLARTSGDERIKKAVTSGLRSPVSTLDDQIKECLEQCGQSTCEDSCGFQELTKIRDLMQTMKENYEEEGADFETVKDDSRRTIMNYISGANKEMNDIITRKVQNDNMLEDCDKEKLDVFNQTKPPMWMLVNETIFAESADGPTTMIDALIELVNGSIENYCSDDGPTPPPPSKENCKLAEYEKVAEYVARIDEIIQEKLFKPTEDGAKVEAQLGFLEVKQMFDARIEELFNGDVKCGDELDKLKKDWMPKLNKCMAQFMNDRKTFSEMSRVERITCTKELRVDMEARRADLLRMELDDLEEAAAAGGEGAGEETEA